MAILGKTADGQIKPLTREKRWRTSKFADGTIPSSFVAVVNYRCDVPHALIKRQALCPGGKPHQARKNAPTEQAAQITESALKAESEAGRLAGQRSAAKPNKTEPTGDPYRTVGSYLAHWVERRVVSESTRIRYRELVKHATRRIGAIPFGELTPDQVGDLYTYLEKERSLSAKTVLNVHRVLHTAFEDAVDGDKLGKNPIRKRIAPRPEAPELLPPNANEAKALIKAAREHSNMILGPIVVLAATTGARQGELLSLKWSDVDLGAGTISIRASTSKTKRGRTLKLTPGAIQELRAHKEALGESEFVFPDGSGKRMDGSNFRRAWRQVCESAVVEVCDESGEVIDSYSVVQRRQRDHLPSIRFHDWRHRAATTMMNNREHQKIASTVLGHSRASMTERYQHPDDVPELRQGTIEALDAVLVP